MVFIFRSPLGFDSVCSKDGRNRATSGAVRKMKDERKPNKRRRRSAFQWKVRLYDPSQGVDSIEENSYLLLSTDNASPKKKSGDREGRRSQCPHT